MAEISTSTLEQARSLKEMTDGIANIDDLTQQNASLAEESAGSAQTLKERLTELHTLVAFFKTDCPLPMGRRPDDPTAPGRSRYTPRPSGRTVLQAPTSA